MLFRGSVCQLWSKLKKMSGSESCAQMYCHAILPQHTSVTPSETLGRQSGLEAPIYIFGDTSGTRRKVTSLQLLPWQTDE